MTPEPSPSHETGAICSVLRWLDANTERYMMVIFYAALALIISVEVLRRYVTGQQSQWGSTVSIYCFIWLSWLGCSYHVKSRSHLRFDGVRAKLPRMLQAVLFILDDLLWLLMASIVVTAAIDLINRQMELGNLIEGTQSVPMALATAAVPFGWGLIVIRSLQDIYKIVTSYRRGERMTAGAPIDG